MDEVDADTLPWYLMTSLGGGLQWRAGVAWCSIPGGDRQKKTIAITRHLGPADSRTVSVYPPPPLPSIPAFLFTHDLALSIGFKLDLDTVLLLLLVTDGWSTIPFDCLSPDIVFCSSEKSTDAFMP